MLLGLKAIPFQLVVLMKDVEQNPIGMGGRKAEAIMQHAGRFMPGSRDIMHLIDTRGTQVVDWCAEAPGGG